MGRWEILHSLRQRTPNPGIAEAALLVRELLDETVEHDFIMYRAVAPKHLHVNGAVTKHVDFPSLARHADLYGNGVHAIVRQPIEDASVVELVHNVQQCCERFLAHLWDYPLGS